MRTFKLIKGELTFDDDNIIIMDDAKKQKKLRLLISIGWIIYGILSVLRYLKTGDPFLLWTGLFIGMGHFIVLILTLLRTAQSKISLTDIKSIKVKQRFNNRFVDIELKNNRVRRITKIDNSDLVNYIEQNFDAKSK